MKERDELVYEDCKRRSIGLPGKPMELCCNCKHWIQHFVLIKGKVLMFTPTASGHCVFPKLKSRRMFESCKHFEVSDHPYEEKDYIACPWRAINEGVSGKQEYQRLIDAGGMRCSEVEDRAVISIGRCVRYGGSADHGN